MLFKNYLNVNFISVILKRHLTNMFFPIIFVYIGLPRVRTAEQTNIWYFWGFCLSLPEWKVRKRLNYIFVLVVFAL